MKRLYQMAQDAVGIEQFAYGNTIIHRMHPGIKLLITCCYTVLVISFPRYAVSGLTAYLLLPVAAMSMARLPYGRLWRRVALALPFALLGGISNVFLDRTVWMTVVEMPLTYGFLSLCSICMKTVLCVVAVLILVGTTPLPELSYVMVAVKVPSRFVMQITLTYRYVTTLLEEASGLYMAYMLRSNQKKGIRLCHMGTFVGQLLLRSIERAQRVYDAMKCRGFSGNLVMRPAGKVCGTEIAVTAMIILTLVFLRINNGSLWLGGLLGV